MCLFLPRRPLPYEVEASVSRRWITHIGYDVAQGSRLMPSASQADIQNDEDLQYYLWKCPAHAAFKVGFYPVSLPDSRLSRDLPRRAG